jgi:hypothetical protein
LRGNRATEASDISRERSRLFSKGCRCSDHFCDRPFILTITREDDHLFAQATVWPKFQILSESDRDYFLKVIDAQITFLTDGNCRATELILHPGVDQHAKRME